MANDNVELAQSAYEAFARGDIPAVMPRSRRTSSGTRPRCCRTVGGRAGARRSAGSSRTSARPGRAFVLELDDIVGSGDRVFAIGRAHGTLKGQETGYGFVHCWTVRDGALARLDEYVDPAPEVYAG